MKSMTGYGKGVCSNADYQVTVEIKSVNGKFLDINTKMERCYLALEDFIKSTIKQEISRGTLDVFVNIVCKTGDKTSVEINQKLFETILAINNDVSTKYRISSNISTKDILKFNGVLNYSDDIADVSILKPIIENATKQALSELLKMKQAEGEKLKVDLLKKIDLLKQNVDTIKEKVPSAIIEYKQKLMLRLKELLNDVSIDEYRLANEMAYYVDKTDINEEVVRLYSHINQFINLAKNDEYSGKKLEFLSQEITREINTTGSKVNNIELTNLVLCCKNINESIKEQIRNVE